jgi:SAM-dependent methyltransferase
VSRPRCGRSGVERVCCANELAHRGFRLTLIFGTSGQRACSVCAILSDPPLAPLTRRPASVLPGRYDKATQHRNGPARILRRMRVQRRRGSCDNSAQAAHNSGFMHEILQSLPAGARVLDLGCAKRSFDAVSTAARVIRIDRDIHFRDKEELVVQGDALNLPFSDCTFAAVISNHSLEHFEDFQCALREIARVVCPQGSLFVSVPDASTFCDKIYRWLAKGGGHVNAFTSSEDLAIIVERATGLKHVATKTLFTSLSFLNYRNSPRPRPRRLILLGGGREWSLFLFAWLSRILDRGFGLRLSVYGWALYFGAVQAKIDSSSYVNVCLRCGSGNPSVQLKQNLLISLRFFRQYRCPQCGARNPFSDDESSGRQTVAC